MIFCYSTYFVLLLSTLLLFYIMPVDYRKYILAISGIIFYLVFISNYYFTISIIVISLLFFFTPKKANNKLILLTPIFLSVLALAFFKFKDSINLLSSFEKNSLFNLVILPLGFSYLVFELISFRIDYTKNKIKKVDFVEFMSFVWFFPTKIAGPIKRYSPFIQNLKNSKFSFEHLYEGSLRIIFGLGKKYILADLLYLIASQLLLHKKISWSPLMAYPFYIYLNFSAYSDIAIGSARLFGIKVPENFNNPYLKTNIRSFWNSWHMSLSFWLRDYLFMNLGKALFKTSLRKIPDFVAVFSYLFTFLICGLWHNGTLNLAIWGLYHGVLLSMHHLYRKYFPSKILQSTFYNSIYMKFVFIIFNFLIISFGWIFFANDMKEINKIFLFLSKVCS